MAAKTILILVGDYVEDYEVMVVIHAPGAPGPGNSLNAAAGIAVDVSGNVYVAGRRSANAFRIGPGGAITEIIDATGDGAGNTLDAAFGIAVDGSGNVYVTGQNNDNAFQITPGGVITEIIDATGDGAGPGRDHRLPTRHLRTTGTRLPLERRTAGRKGA